MLLLTTLGYLINSYRLQQQTWDDAYITFRFSENLGEGHGLVWNRGGERVEGYTSALHVFMLALGQWVGIPPENVILPVSVVSVLATFGLLLFILYQHFGSLHPIAMVPLALYLLDERTAVHTTSGLETQLFVFLLCLAYMFALSFVRNANLWSSVGLGVTTLLSILCRPEGVIFGLVVYLTLGAFALAKYRAVRVTTSETRYLILSSVVLGSLGLFYAFWKWRYFGYLMPNSYYVKSGRLSLSGLWHVAHFIKSIGIQYGVIAIGICFFIPWKRVVKMLSQADVKARLALTVGPPILGLVYYSTIIHEVGAASRFSYPTYFYFVIALALMLSYTIVSRETGSRLRLLKAMVLVAALTLVGTSLKLDISVAPDTDFNLFHYKIAESLETTGLRSNATILCDAAGIIPYVSKFDHIDRVGLVDNYLSGRYPVTPEERENYIWQSKPDIYIGHEPPASDTTSVANEDMRMRTPYVQKVLIGAQLAGIEDRFLLQDPKRLHARMCELRDHWIFVGELISPAWFAWKRKTFLYVRTDSPHKNVLIPAMEDIVDLFPDQVDLRQLN
jgi:hypothetical protein